VAEEKSINLKLIAIIGVAVVLLSVGLAFGVTTMILSKVKPEGGGKANTQVTSTEVGALVDIGEFTSNLASDGGSRFIKVKVVLGLSEDEEKLKAEVSQEKLPKIQDTIINLLRSKTAEELSEADAADKLKVQIKDKINEFLTKGRVGDVYFTYLVIQ